MLSSVTHLSINNATFLDLVVYVIALNNAKLLKHFHFTSFRFVSFRFDSFYFILFHFISLKNIRMHLSLTQQQTWLLGQRALQGTLGRPQGLGRLTHLPSTSWQKRSLYVNKNGRHFISWKNIQTVVLFANLDPRAFFEIGRAGKGSSIGWSQHPELLGVIN